MAPSPDDDFYRRPPPPGRSRESTIVLAKDGRFFHDGELVEHPRMGEAMHGWISRHLDDGRVVMVMEHGAMTFHAAQGYRHG